MNDGLIICFRPPGRLRASIPATAELAPMDAPELHWVPTREDAAFLAALSKSVDRQAKAYRRLRKTQGTGL